MVSVIGAVSSARDVIWFVDDSRHGSGILLLFGRELASLCAIVVTASADVASFI